MAKLPGNNSVLIPNLGIYLDRPPIALNKRMLQDGINFRVRKGRLTNKEMGWALFDNLQLDGPVMLIDEFFVRGAANGGVSNAVDQLIFATKQNLYVYDTTAPGQHLHYLNPTVSTGTVSLAGTTVTGVGTAFVTSAIKAGDQITFGTASENSLAANWFAIDHVNTNLELIITTAPGPVAPGTPYTIRRIFTGTENDLWFADVFVNASPSNKNEWWLTNGIDSIVRWNGVSASAEYMDTVLGFRAKSLRVYRNMMCFFGIAATGGALKPTDMINSNPGEPQNVTSGLSEQFKVHSGSDSILWAHPLGDNLIIYSENTITVAQFIGDPLIFAFRNAVVGRGPIAAKAVARFPDYHIFLGRDTAYEFDGASAKRVGGQVWRNILPLRDPTRQFQAYAYIDEENGEINWSLPRSDDPGAGIVTASPRLGVLENYIEEVSGGKETPIPPMSFRSFPFTCAGRFNQANLTLPNQLGFSLAGDTAGKIYRLNQTENANGLALASSVKFGRRPLADGRMRAMLRRVYPFVATQSNGLNVTVHLSDHALGAATINTNFVFDQTLPEGVFMVPVYRRGRYVELEFTTTGPSQPWELSGYDLDVISGGYR